MYGQADWTLGMRRGTTEVIVMRVAKLPSSDGDLGSPGLAFLDDGNTPVVAVSGFLRALVTRGCFPNVLAYAHDASRLCGFVQQERVTVATFTPVRATDSLAQP